MKIILSFLIVFISFGTFAQTNFVDSSSWTVGLPTNQQGSFVSSGGDALNEVVNGTNPFGSSTALWQTTSNGPNSYPGLKINNLTVNTATTYRFSIWVKQLNSTTPNYALKIKSNATDGLIKSDGTFTNDNYLTAWQLPTNSEWFLIVGYIKGNSDGSSYPEAGVYDISTSTQLPLGYSTYNFNTTTTSIEVSAFIYGSSDANDKILFFDPRMEIVNGQEPNIAELLSPSGSTGGETPEGTVWNFNGADINYMDGNVGLGTTVPSSKLHIVKDYLNGNSHSFSLLTLENTNHSMMSILTPNNKSGYYGFADLEDDFVGGIQYNHITNSMSFRVNNHVNDVIIDENGNMAIGTNSVPTGHKLAVNGSIITTEVLVKLQANWPDYVFTENYKLPSLSEVAKHIEENGHLINIPSAQEVAANGIELGEMNKLLLEKIEELTLYILEQEKRIQLLESKK